MTNTITKLSEAGYSSMPQFFHLDMLYDAYILVREGIEFLF